METNTKNKTLIGNLQILIGGAFFGLIPILIRYGRDINLVNLVFFRAFFGAVTIWVFLKISNKNLASIKGKIKHFVIWSLILLLAISFYFYSLKKTDIASATLLLNLNSIFIIIFSRFFLKERLNQYTIISLLLSLIGAYLIIGWTKDFKSLNIVGIFSAIIAAFWTGLNFIYPKIFLKPYDAFSMTFFQSLFQLPFLLPFILIYAQKFEVTNFTILFLLGVVCTALAFILIYSGSQKTKSQFIGILQTSESIVPILLAIILFNEVPSGNKIWGGIFLLFSYLVIFLKPENRST